MVTICIGPASPHGNPRPLTHNSTPGSGVYASPSLFNTITCPRYLDFETLGGIYSTIRCDWRPKRDSVMCLTIKDAFYCEIPWSLHLFGSAPPHGSPWSLTHITFHPWHWKRSSSSLEPKTRLLLGLKRLGTTWAGYRPKRGSDHIWTLTSTIKSIQNARLPWFLMLWKCCLWTSL